MPLRCSMLPGRFLLLTVLAVGQPAPAKAEKSNNKTEVVSSLIAQLKDSNAKVRAKAAQVLGTMGPIAQAAVPALINLLKDRDNEVRHKAYDAFVAVLAGADKQTGVAIFSAALKHQDPEIREAFAMGLGEMGVEAKAVVPALVEALTDSSRRVRQEVAHTLGKMGVEAKAAVPALIKALQDEDDDFREQAIEVLGGLGSEAKAAVPGLIALLKENTDRLPQQAASALAKIGPAAVPALLLVAVPGPLDASSKEKLVSDHAFDALAEMGAAAVPSLVAALKDKDALLRERGLGTGQGREGGEGRRAGTDCCPAG